MIDILNLEYNGRAVKLLHQGFDIVIIMDKETKKQSCVSPHDVGLKKRERPFIRQW